MYSNRKQLVATIFHNITVLLCFFYQTNAALVNNRDFFHIYIYIYKKLKNLTDSKPMNGVVYQVHILNDNPKYFHYSVTSIIKGA